MLDLFNIAKPQGCDIQTFYAASAATQTQSWSKPRGVSNIYMLLIGSGASGSTSTGGGSGAVTVWYGAAVNVPDQLRVIIGTTATTIRYQQKDGTGYALLNASSGSGSSSGGASAANQFAASGFYQSIAGQDGILGSVSASSTTFLSGGGGSGSVNYGYTSAGVENHNGYLLLQPIIVGMAGGGTGKGGPGCGGGYTSGAGGPGLVLIASW